MAKRDNGFEKTKAGGRPKGSTGASFKSLTNQFLDANFLEATIKVTSITNGNKKVNELTFSADTGEKTFRESIVIIAIIKAINDKRAFDYTKLLIERAEGAVQSQPPISDSEQKLKESIESGFLSPAELEVAQKLLEILT